VSFKLNIKNKNFPFLQKVETKHIGWDNGHVPSGSAMSALAEVNI